MVTCEQDRTSGWGAVIVPGGRQENSGFMCPAQECTLQARDKTGLILFQVKQMILRTDLHRNKALPPEEK